MNDMKIIVDKEEVPLTQGLAELREKLLIPSFLL